MRLYICNQQKNFYFVKRGCQVMRIHFTKEAMMNVTRWCTNADRDHKASLFAGTMGWGLDAFDNLIFSFTIYSLTKEWSLTSTTTGMIASCTLLSSALGGILFGIFADKNGRTKALIYSVLVYAVFTGFCGLAPSVYYLLIARILVGLGLGGEWAVGTTLISESWPKEHRGKAMCIMQSGYAVGGMIAALISGPIIAAFSWRCLYFIGALPALLVFYIRRNVKEPEAWIENERKKSRDKNKAYKKIKENPLIAIFMPDVLKKTLVGSIFASLLMIVSSSLQTWTAVYLATPSVDGGAGMSTVGSSLMLFPQFLGSLPGYMIFGYFSDKIDRRKVFFIYLICAAIICPLLIWTARVSMPIYILTSFLYGSFAVGMFAGLGPFLSEIFSTKMRSTGVGFCFNCGKVVGALAVTVVGILSSTFELGIILSLLCLFFFLAIGVVYFFMRDRSDDVLQ